MTDALFCKWESIENISENCSEMLSNPENFVYSVTEKLEGEYLGITLNLKDKTWHYYTETGLPALETFDDLYVALEKPPMGAFLYSAQKFDYATYFAVRDLMCQGGLPKFDAICFHCEFINGKGHKFSYSKEPEIRIFDASLRYRNEWVRCGFLNTKVFVAEIICDEAFEHFNNLFVPYLGTVDIRQVAENNMTFAETSAFGDFAPKGWVFHPIDPTEPTFKEVL